MQKHQLKTLVSQLSPHVCAAIIREIRYTVLDAQRSFKKETAKSGGNEEKSSEHDQLIRFLTDQATMRELYRKCSEMERDILHYFMFQVGNDLLTYREIQHEKTGFKNSYFRLGLTGLRRKGMIFTVRRQWGEEAYFLPVELEEVLYSVYLSSASADEKVVFLGESSTEEFSKEGFSSEGFSTGEFSKEVSSNEGLSKEKFSKEKFPNEGFSTGVSSAEISSFEESFALEIIKESASSPFYKDLLYLLDELRQEKKIPLTQKQGIHKRVIRKWEEILSGRHLDLLSYHVYYKEKETYPAPVAIAVDFLTEMGGFLWYADRIELNERKVIAWLEKGSDRLRTDFLQYWQQHFKPKTAWQERYLKDMLRVSNQKRWVSLLAFVERWEEHYVLPSIKQLQDELLKLIDPFVQLGLLKLGRSGSNEWYWSWTVWENTATELWIQPDLELMCAGNSAAGDVWTLAECCDISQWEQMLVLKLSQRKVFHYLEKGESISKWLEWLSRLAKVPVPDTLVDQLAQWQKKKQKVIMEDITLIEVEDDTLRHAILHWAEDADLTLYPVGPSHLAAPIAMRDTVYSLLSSKQIHVLHKREREAGDLVEPPRLILEQGDQERHLLIESVFPEWTDAVPAWNQLPSMWTKQFTSYHEKTKREMVTQAVEHQLWLNIQGGKQEYPVQIVPTRCFAEQGEWYVEDQQQRKLCLTDINRIQLVFPLSPKS